MLKIQESNATDTVSFLIRAGGHCFILDSCRGETTAEEEPLHDISLYTTNRLGIAGLAVAIPAYCLLRFEHPSHKKLLRIIEIVKGIISLIQSPQPGQRRNHGYNR